MSHIYTRTGDEGETGLFGGGRVPKAHPRVEAYGAVDELNAVLGWAATTQADAGIARQLTRLQPDLFVIGAHLARPAAAEGRRAPELPDLPHERIAEMEASIDAAEGELPPLRNFVLPGGALPAAALHVTRTVCRRAERRVVALAAREVGAVDPFVLVYLNRLSDLLFTLARLANLRTGTAEPEWRPADPA